MVSCLPPALHCGLEEPLKLRGVRGVRERRHAGARVQCCNSDGAAAAFDWQDTRLCMSALLANHSLWSSRTCPGGVRAQRVAAARRAACKKGSIAAVLPHSAVLRLSCPPRSSTWTARQAQAARPRLTPLLPRHRHHPLAALSKYSWCAALGMVPRVAAGGPPAAASAPSLHSTPCCPPSLCRAAADQ